MPKRFVIAKSFRMHISKPKNTRKHIFVDISKVRKSSRRGLLCRQNCILSQKSIPQFFFWGVGVGGRAGGRAGGVAGRGGREEDGRGEEEGEKGERVEEDSLAMRVAMGLLDFYKREISPALPKSCRFVPTCSEYARQAYKKYGTKKGFVLTAWRIMRCNPLGGKGYDPPMWPPVYLGSDPVRLDDER